VADAPSVRSSNLTLAIRDLGDGLKSIHVWPMLAWQEVRQRYRRSVLGPFWLTISTGLMVAGMGPLYGHLLRQDVGTYFGYLAISLITWQFIANLINESCNAFISAEGYIKQIKLPLSIHVFRCVWRNLIVYAHNFVIILLVFLLYPPENFGYLLLAPIGVLLIAVNGVWFGIALGLLCARYRDIPQIVSSLVQVMFFLTPVMWKAEMLGKYHLAADLNPLYHFLEIVRGPLLGRMPGLLTWAWVLVMTVVGYLFMMALFSRFRARIAYWV
jgi:lipopolysaccharide transport system permease protein